MDKPSTRKRIIEAYIKDYNNFNIEGMLAHLHQNIVFCNINNGIETLKTIGKKNFEFQANQAKNAFLKREQKILSWEIDDDSITLKIEYNATLSKDLINGLKSGHKFCLTGQSVFKFSDNYITEIIDIC